jgi:endonuclease/exonuclease/phosphatase family metal-dependent hydrolase
MFSIEPVVRYTLLALFLTSLPPADARDNLSLLTFNVERLFDDRDDGMDEPILSTGKYRGRIHSLARLLRDSVGTPEVIALQEIENLRVLEDLAQALESATRSYRAVLLTDAQASQINLGFLIDTRLKVGSVQRWFAGRNMDGRDIPLFSRPPLAVEVCAVECVTLVNLHLRSMRGLGKPGKTRKVAEKRRQQAEAIARKVQSLLHQTPGAQLLLLGDFNALPRSDQYVDVLGTIIGQPDQARPRWKSKDLLNPDLVDLTRQIPRKQRYSFIYRDRRQQIDYAVASPPLAARLHSIRFEPINYRISDHAPLLVELDFPLPEG